MLIYVRVKEHLKQRIDGLIAKGHYSNINTVITVALENLLVAEEEAESGQTAPASIVERSMITEPERTPTVRPITRVTKIPATPEPKIRETNMEWVRFVDLSDDLLIPIPADLFKIGQRVPVERWVFGQQNRVLPAKVNARIFTIITASHHGDTELFEAAHEISAKAADAFTFLDQLDQKFDNGKDDLLSTGFPEPGSDKALSRYANHFAAYESTQGNLTGMLIQWKLAGVKRAKNKTYLVPTKACVEFAKLPNPLLDRPVADKPGAKFSSDEIGWAIDHITAHVPVEASAFTTILDGLAQGCNTPDALDEYVRENAKEKTDLSPAFISTQRSGAVSRMADLTLVRRQRDGTKVSYEITELGTKWLDCRTRAGQS